MSQSTTQAPAPVPAGIYVPLANPEAVTVVAAAGAGLTLLPTVVGYDVTLTANLTVTMPKAVRGQFGYIIVRQAATGGPFTVTLSGAKWPGGSAPTMSTGAGAIDRYDYVSDGTLWLAIITGQNFE